MIASVGPEAARELIDAAAFYAQAGEHELGLMFVAEFERAAALLCAHPRIGAIWRGTTRRFPLRRFPYNIIYQIKPEEIRIIAVAHQRRKPGYWWGRQ